MNGTDVLALPAHLVEAPQVSLLRLGVPVAGIAEVVERGEPVAATHARPVVIPNTAAVPHATRPEPGAVVLQSAVDIERDVHVHVDVVELRERQVRHKPPRRSAVVGDADPTVVAHDEKAGIDGIDPQFLHVAVNLLTGHHGPERASLVFAHRDTAVQAIEPVLVLGIDPDVGVVERPRCHARFVADRAPRDPAVVGP